MKVASLLFIFGFTFTKGNIDQESSFMQYNLELLSNIYYKPCQNPKFFVEMANIEESKPENQDKIILYHGQSYGVWLFQLIFKALMFPEADEDWLPLRLNSLENDIDRTNLMKMIKNNGYLDFHQDYKEIGLSVSANLVSKFNSESAWYFICVTSSKFWHKLSGLSSTLMFHSSMYQILRERFIPEQNWEQFKRQKKLLYKYIQIKRNLYRQYDVISLYNAIQTLFPKTFDEYQEYLESLPLDWEKYQNRKRDNFEGVALQIIMDKNLGDELTYSSHSFGWVKSKRYKKYENSNNMAWEGEDIEPYSEVYEQIKNKEDFNQARLALNKEFRSFPSRVRIKSIAGIMENPVDYEILKSMIREMVEVNKKKNQ